MSAFRGHVSAFRGRESAFTLDAVRVLVKSMRAITGRERALRAFMIVFILYM